MADLTADRIRRNNSVFRDANERISAASRRLDHDVDRIPFLCECPVEACVEIIRLTEAEYTAIRADPRHYVTAVGHETAERPVGEVVERRDGYIVVEKR